MQYESKEQELLFQWAEFQKGKYPSLRLMFHIPNGGSRNAIEAANLKNRVSRQAFPTYACRTHADRITVYLSN